MEIFQQQDRTKKKKKMNDKQTKKEAKLTSLTIARNSADNHRSTLKAKQTQTNGRQPIKRVLPYPLLCLLTNGN